MSTGTIVASSTEVGTDGMSRLAYLDLIYLTSFIVTKSPKRRPRLFKGLPLPLDPLSPLRRPFWPPTLRPLNPLSLCRSCPPRTLSLRSLALLRRSCLLPTPRLRHPCPPRKFWRFLISARQVLLFVGTPLPKVESREFTKGGTSYSPFSIFFSHTDKESRHTVQPLVSGVSGACYLRHSSETEARNAYQEAWNVGQIQAIPM
jgi:hypothetical protein